MEDYLKSDILYWQLTPAGRITPPPPMLTVGGYLLRAHRLRGLWDALNGEQRLQLETAEKAFQAVTNQWVVHTEKRVERELGARLNSWGWFVDDCQANKPSCIAYYATEAELRTIIGLLLESAGDSPQTRLQGLDALFRNWFKPGPFVWRPELAPAYPQARFWWLYGRPEFPPR